MAAHRGLSCLSTCLLPAITKVTEMLNAKPGRQTQAEVPSLSSLPILTLLPLNSAIHSTYTEKRSVPIPAERGEARKELTHSSFLVTHRHDTTLSPSQHTYPFLVPLLAQMSLE